MAEILNFRRCFNRELRPPSGEILRIRGHFRSVSQARGGTELLVLQGVKLVGLEGFEPPTHGLGNLFKSNCQVVGRKAENPTTPFLPSSSRV